MFFFPFPLYCVDEGMRFWKWILITTVKVFAYSASIGWRSLRCVCVWSELEIHTRVSKGSKFTVWSRTSVYMDTHIQLTTLAMAPVFLTQKSSTHGASVLFHMLVGEWTLMQPSRLQKRRNDNLSIHNTVTLNNS